MGIFWGREAVGKRLQNRAGIGEHMHPERGGQGKGSSEQPGKQALKISKTVRRGHEQGVLAVGWDELGVYNEPQLHACGVISCLRGRFLGSVSQWLPFSPSSGQGL